MLLQSFWMMLLIGTVEQLSCMMLAQSFCGAVHCCILVSELRLRSTKIVGAATAADVMKMKGKINGDTSFL